jgi:hypothetical protein
MARQDDERRHNRQSKIDFIWSYSATNSFCVRLEANTNLILRSLRSKRLEGWRQSPASRPCFETPREDARLLRMRLVDADP